MQVIRSVATLSVNPGDAEIQFALPEAALIQWARIGWIPVHHGGSAAMSAVTVADSASRPVLFVVMRRPAPQAPAFHIRTMAVGTRAGDLERELPQADARYDSEPAQCRGNSWISAFFIEGVGPPPSHPVVFRYESEGRVHRLRIDPVRNMLRGPETLRLPIAGAEAAEPIPASRSLSIQFAGVAPPMVPVFVTRDARGWRGIGGTPSHRSSHWGPGGMHDPPVEESRLYLLGPVPGCPGEQIAGPR